VVVGGGNASTEYWNSGGSVLADTPTLKSGEVKNGVYKWERFYLGDYQESPLYRGGWMQDRCNGTRVSGSYKIMWSVTASEIFTGTWERDVTVRLNWSLLPNTVFGLDLLFALNNWAYVSDQSRTCIIDGYKQRPKLYIMTQIKKYIKEHTHHITYIDHPRSKIYQWNLCVYDLLLHESRCSIFADIILKSMNDCTGWILGYPWKQGRQRTTPSSKTLILSRS